MSLHRMDMQCPAAQVMTLGINYFSLISISASVSCLNMGLSITNNCRFIVLTLLGLGANHSCGLKG
jgi:hypothetical protein